MWIKLYRQIQDHKFLNKDPACNFRAWVDLLMLASHNEHKTVIKKMPFMLSRGDFAASIRFLRKRWQWGAGKTLAFLASLEIDGMIVKKRNGSGSGSPSIYHIVNYDTYQGDIYQISTVAGTLPGTLPERFRNETNKGKEGKRNTSALRRTFSDLHVGESRKSSGAEEEFDEEGAQESLEKELEETEARLRSKPNLTKKEKRWLDIRARKKKAKND
jgi:hypothetical protein